MRLYLNETSPFSRVAVATALLSQCTPLSLVWVDPWRSSDTLKRVNPFCVIPALALEDGITLTESLCICQYLIERHQPQGLRQVAANEVNELAQLGMAKTLMEIAFRTAVLLRYTEKNNELIQRGQDGMREALTRLNHQIACHPFEANLATLYLHVALDYVQFRHSTLFNEVAGGHLADFLQGSPFANVLSYLSIECLTAHPDYSTLLASYTHRHFVDS